MVSSLQFGQLLVCCYTHGAPVQPFVKLERQVPPCSLESAPLPLITVQLITRVRFLNGFANIALF